MREWLPFRDQMLDRVLQLEGPQDRRRCAMCSKEWSIWRCIDCVGRPSLCTDCCLDRHSIDYLHHLERWVPKGAKQAVPVQARDEHANAEEADDEEANGEEADAWVDELESGVAHEIDPSIEGAFLHGHLMSTSDF